jgi:polyisoprenoid-binding protein YceI
MLRFSALQVCALTAAFGGAAPPALADVSWSLDAAHSTVSLSVSHLLISRISGTLPFTSATVVTPDGDAVPLTVDATLSAAALTTHDPQRDAQLRSDRFFDVARYPTISFASERIAETGPRTFTIEGELTMRGVTKPMTLNARCAGVSRDASGTRRVRYEASGRFRRSDYGMAYARGFVGNDVALDIVLEAVEPAPAH